MAHYPSLMHMMGVGALFLTLASASVGMAERGLQAPPTSLSEGFQLMAPTTQVEEEGTLDFLFNHALRNASLTDMRIEAAGLTLADGSPITGYAFKKEAGVVVGVGAPLTDIGLTSLKAMPGKDLEVMAVFQKDHQPVTPRNDQLAVFDLNTFKRLDWSFAKGGFVGKKRLAAYLLVDSSTSMDRFEDSIKQSAKEFFLAMPDGVACHLSKFSGHLENLSPKPESCQEAAKRLERMTLNGGLTGLYQALRDIYLRAANDGYDHSLVILLSDGRETGYVSKAAALSNKRRVNGQTLVLWLGEAHKTDLQGLIDVEMETGANVQAGLKKYLKNLQLFVNGQRLLTVKR